MGLRARILWLGCLVTASALLSVASSRPAPADAAAVDSRGSVLLVDIGGGIGPATRDHVGRTLARAVDAGAAAVVLRIDTPGGLDAATRDINRAILAAEVPVIAWVAPEGARAASAGTYLVYASHLAAMAPATSLGAATPIAMGGAPRQRDRTAEEEGEDSKAPSPASGSAAERKAVNDSIAYLRSLAELRGRDADFAEAAVRDAATLTAQQALERKVVEIVASDVASLLSQADGREVALAGGRVTLAVAGRAVIEAAPDWRVALLSVLTEPTIAYLLLLVGLYGLMFEGYSPGAIVPGVIGGICLLLGLYALQVLPVNYAGVALIVLGVALMATEFASPSFGVLGIGGLVALLVGSVILFDEVPGFGVPLPLIAGVGLASGLGFMAVLWLALRARHRPVVSGIAELLGHEAVVVADFEGRGQVRVRGETWQALSDAPLRRGQRVRVQAVDGLRLRVVPGGEPPPPTITEAMP